MKYNRSFPILANNNFFSPILNYPDIYYYADKRVFNLIFSYFQKNRTDLGIKYLLELKLEDG